MSDNDDWDDRGFSRSRYKDLEREAADIFQFASGLPQADAELLEHLWAERSQWDRKNVNVKEWLLEEYGLQQTKTQSGLSQFDAFSQGAFGGDSSNTEKLQALAVECVARLRSMPRRAASLAPGPAATGGCAS